MSVLELTTEQVVSLVRQLPPEGKRKAVLALAEEAQIRREERMSFAEAQLRRLATARGLIWDSLSEAERERFVDELLHEK